MIRVFLIAVLISMVSTEARAQVGGGGGSMDTYSLAEPLQQGDLVRLGFWLDQDLSGDYSVDERGEVVLPLVGVVSARGISPRELKDRIRTNYRRLLKDQEVHVITLRRVRILGQVRRPGLYHAEPGMGLGDLLALAEGATDDGDLNRVRLFRSGQVLEEGIGDGMNVTARLQSGDQLFVPKQSWLRRNSTAVFGAAASITAALVYRGLASRN